MGGRETPQGAVLSPFLFNVALCRLPEQLSQIPGLKHSLYADDVTLWAEAGTAGSLEGILQEGIDVVQKYAGIRDMACSTEKSEYMVLRPVRRGKATPQNEPPKGSPEASGLPTAENMHQNITMHVAETAASIFTNDTIRISGVLLSGGSIATTSTEDAEETAIALASRYPTLPPLFRTPSAQFKITPGAHIEVRGQDPPRL
ncbi:hypothetical protein HPB47_016538, partial [Ixodes persulcatus]